MAWMPSINLFCAPEHVEMNSHMPNCSPITPALMLEPFQHLEFRQNLKIYFVTCTSSTGSTLCDIYRRYIRSEMVIGLSREEKIGNNQRCSALIHSQLVVVDQRRISHSDLLIQTSTFPLAVITYCHVVSCGLACVCSAITCTVCALLSAISS